RAALRRHRSRTCHHPQARPHDGWRRDVTSEPDKGSVFTVRLPGSADSQARSSTGSDDRRSPTAHCILVIDDDATARELIADHLKAEGFSVVTAAAGGKGAKPFSRQPPTAHHPVHHNRFARGWGGVRRIRAAPEPHPSTRRTT